MNLTGFPVLAAAAASLALGLHGDGLTSLLAETRDIRDDVILSTPLVLRLDWKLAGALRREPMGLECELAVHAGIRLTSGAIWVGLTVGDRREISHVDGAPDWESLTDALAEYKQMPAFEDRDQITLAASEEVRAEHIATAARRAIDSGFGDVRYSVPGWEPVKFDQDGLDERFPLRALGDRSVTILTLESSILVGDDTGAIDFIPMRRRGRDDRRKLRAVLEQYREKLGGRAFFSSDTAWSACDEAELSRARSIDRVAIAAGLSPIFDRDLRLPSPLSLVAEELGLGRRN